MDRRSLEGALAKVIPAPAVLDWGLLVSILVVAVTGLVGLLTARPADAWLFVAHGVTGLLLALFVPVKLWRVRTRIQPDTLTGRRWISVGLAVLAVIALVTGIGWTVGLAIPGPWTLLVVHMVIGALLVSVLGAHLTYRFHRPEAVLAGTDRRTALRSIGAIALAAVAWRLSQFVGSITAIARRHTGARRAAGDSGNSFPVTMWVADDPDPIDAASWQLTVEGAVRTERSLTLDDLPEMESPIAGIGSDFTDRSERFDASVTDSSSERGTLRSDETTAVLDCTSGWYAERPWQGITVGELLDDAGVNEAARWVQFRSVTGYRWSLPIGEARDALLATHVDGEPLTHGHGWPLRLVAPGRRGFQWVKWVETVHVSRTRDLSEVVAIFISGFDDGNAGE